MLKKAVLVLLLLTQAINADELPADCEAAVDAADRLGSASDKRCDYSSTGLNGVLHRALASKPEAAEPPARSHAASDASSYTPRTLVREFDSAQQLSLVRYELIVLAGKECQAGFTLVDERYLPVAKHLKLELTYHCL